MKLLKFEASHCMQCKGLDMRMNGWNKVPVEHVDAEEDDARAEKYNIRNLPTLILVDDYETKEYGRWGNVPNMNEIDEVIDKISE